MSPLLKKKNGEITDKALLRRYCIGAGVLALFVMMFVYLCHNNSLYPWGDNTVLRMDLYHQYGPLYAELYDRITNGYSLVFSWTSGLGGSFLGNLFNYCCSPFALIMAFTGHKNMPEAIALMILLKAVFSSVSFTYYINKTTRKITKSSIAFGLLYAFCSFFVAYSWNIMWLDGMSIFPLVILGIEKIIQDKKPSLFIFALTYTMITNYYIAYMVCLLSVIYFLYYYFGRYEFTAKLVPEKAVQENDVWAVAPSEAAAPAEADNIITAVSENTEAVKNEDIIFENITADDIVQNVTEAAAEKPVLSASVPEEAPGAAQIYSEPAKKVKKRKPSLLKRSANSRFFVTGSTFAFSAILCFMLSAFALIPVYFCLQSSSATSSSFPDDLKVYFNIFDFLANHLAGVNTTIRSSGNSVFPNVYCGLITLMLVPLYFFSSKIKSREKFAAVVVLAVFYISFSFNYLNYTWHGFHFPNDLPYRFSFAYSFIILTLAYKAFQNIEDFSKKAFVGLGMITLGFIVLVQELTSANVERYAIIVSIVFAVVYIVIFGMIKSVRYQKKAIVNLLIFAVIAELCIANTPHYAMSQSKTNYTSDYDSFQQISDTVDSADDDLFYRSELTKLRARMDPCWYGYNGVSTFSSMAYEHVANLMRSIGMFGNKINSYTYYPQTAIFNSMFSIKYLYDHEKLINNSDIYTNVASNDYYNAYEYEYYLPLAFSVDKAVANWDLSSTNPFTVQNNLMETATGISDILEPIEATDIFTSGVNAVSLSSVNNSSSFSINKSAAGTKATVKVYIDVTEEADIYVYAGSTKISSITINAENFTYSVNSSIQPFILDVGKQPAGARVEIIYELGTDTVDSTSLSFCACTLNEEKFEAAYNKIKSNGTVNLTEFNETSMSGTISVNNDNALIYTSIPYDESWTITVDGEKIEYYNSETDESSDGKAIAVGNALIGINVEKGEHTISFKYNAKGLSDGIRFTIFGFGVLILLLMYKFFISKKLAASGKRTQLFKTPEENIY